LQPLFIYGKIKPAKQPQYSSSKETETTIFRQTQTGTMQTLTFIFILFLSLFLVIKSADLAIHYSSKVAKSFLLPKYVIGFLVVAFIGIMPEVLISVTSALKGMPSFGLGTLLGTNIANLSMTFALVVILSGKSLKVESRVIKKKFLYIGTISIPILFGLNGYFSRLEGIILIVTGIIFYYFVLTRARFDAEATREKFSIKDFSFLLLSMALLLVGAHLTVKYGIDFANHLNINPILIGMFIVGLGATVPELFFSLRAAKQKHDSLALGDILGSVLADATIVIGLVALISPFAFDPSIIYKTGFFMIFAASLLMYLMKTGKVLTRHEAYLLLVFYLVFAFTEIIINN
jgi:cation:H+ antiporter